MEFFDPATIMCEVVMDEDCEDNETPNTLNRTENLDLPPIPRFDLQSEPYSYFPSFDPVPIPLAPARIKLNKKFHQLKEDCSILKLNDTLAPIETKIKQAIDKDKTPRDKFYPSIIFNLPFLKMVYTTPDDPPENLQSASIEEMKFYSQYFTDTSKIPLFRLHCSTCDKHIGSGASITIKRHRGLNVLVCKSCYDFYGDDKFPTDKEDNTEVFCRWCGQGGNLVCCSFCPKVFCNSCINRNFNISYWRQIQAADDWACFFCASKPLWALRAICRALLHYRSTNCLAEDDTTCCKKKKVKTPTFSKETKSVEKPMVVFNPDISKLCPTPRLRAVSPRNTTPTPRTPVAIRPAPPQLKPSPNVLSPVSGNRPKLVPPASPPPLAIRSKILAPPEPRPSPSRTPVTKKPPTTNITNTNKGVPKIQDIHVDHTKTTCALVKLSSTSGFEHSLRIHIQGDCLKTPPPVLNPNFPTKSLEHSFKIQSKIFESLISLNKNKVISAEAKSSSLLTILSDWKAAIDIVEMDLKHNLDIHRSNLKKRSDQAKSSESQMRWNFPSKFQKLFDADSDIEIIDDDSDSEKNDHPKALKRKNSDGAESSVSKIARTDGMSNGNENSISFVEKEEISNSTDNKGEGEVVELNSSDAPDEIDLSLDTRSKKGINNETENGEISCIENNKSNDNIIGEDGEQDCSIEEIEGNTEKIDNENSECVSLIEDDEISNRTTTTSNLLDDDRNKLNTDLEMGEVEDKADSRNETLDVPEKEEEIATEEHDTDHTMENNKNTSVESSEPNSFSEGEEEETVNEDNAMEVDKDPLVEEVEPTSCQDKKGDESDNEHDTTPEDAKNTDCKDLEHNETNHSLEEADSPSSKEEDIEAEEIESERNCTIEDVSKTDLEEISSSVKEGYEKNTQEVINEKTGLVKPLDNLDLEEIEDNTEENEIQNQVKGDLNLADDNSLLESDGDNIKNDTNKETKTNEPPQEDADIIKLLDGEISKLENASHSMDNLSDSNESSIKFDQTLLDEIDNVG